MVLHPGCAAQFEFNGCADHVREWLPKLIAAITGTKRRPGQKGRSASSARLVEYDLLVHTNDEAYSTAYGMIAAMMREDVTGWETLWRDSEDKEEVAHALTAAGIRMVELEAERQGVSTKEILDNLRGS